MLNTHLHQVIGERYTLTQILGEGAMGRVYLATDQMLGQVPVAIKVLSQSLPEEAMRQRFRQEALACAALGQKSLHIVRVTDFGITDWGSPFYVMEYLPGQTLRELIGQGLAPDRWKKIATQMLLGLQAAHEGVVIQGRTVQVIHRDLKPANVMVMPDPSLGELVKLVDFGVAKFLSEQGHVSLTHGYVGTLAYSSPEQLEGLPLDPRSDLYSLGLILYQMACGRLPFIPPTDTFAGWYQVHRKQRPAALPPAVAERFPSPWQELIFACLEKNPAHRPPSAAALLEQLGHSIPAPTPALNPATARSTRYIPPPPPEPTGIPGWLALLAGSLVGVLAVTGLSLALRRDPYEAAMEQGQTALSQGDAARAVSQFQVALQHRPQDRQALSGLALAQRQLAAQPTTPEPQPLFSPSPEPQPLLSPTPLATVQPPTLETSPELQGSQILATLESLRETLEGFQVNRGQPTVREGLGSPVASGSQGGYPSETFRLPGLPMQVTVTYDREGTVRHNRVEGIPPAAVSTLLRQMLEVSFLSQDLQQKVQRIQTGQSQRETFVAGSVNLQGEILRDPQGTVTISTWDAQRPLRIHRANARD
ncbi:MAG: protein kinase [Thermostichales cyanobacterium BF4_bins_65]